MGTGWAGQKSARRQSPASCHIRMEMWMLAWVQQAQGTVTQQMKPFSENTVFAFYSLDVSKAGLGWPFIIFWQVLSKVSCPPSWSVMRDTSWVLCSCDRKKSLVTLWVLGWCCIPRPAVPATCYHRISRCMHQATCARFGLLFCPIC